MLNVVSRTEKDKDHMISFIVESKKQNKGINKTKQKRQNQTYKHRGQTGHFQWEGSGGWTKWVTGSGRYRFPVTEGVSHGDRGTAQGILLMEL